MSAKHVGGLGKGIDALISDKFDKTILNESNERIQNLFIKDISPLKDQPRKTFDDVGIRELAESIKQYGVIQPLIVSASDTGEYIIVAGERRWRAAKLAGLDKVPVIVRAPKQQEKLEIALIENVQRVDLSPLETAIAIEKLHQDFNLSYQDIAKRLSKAPTTVNNTVRLLQLPDLAMKALNDNKITEGHARAILSLKDNETKQLMLLKNIIDNRWSVRQAEQFVISSKQGAETIKQVTQKMSTSTPETERLSKRLNTPVSIKRTARGGRLEIRFSNDEELKALFDKLK
ncbi:MAG: ParB/RepB/Spo0J family partition protein [Candidatus Saccharimonadales bacterium]